MKKSNILKTLLIILISIVTAVLGISYTIAAKKGEIETINIAYDQFYNQYPNGDLYCIKLMQADPYGTYLVKQTVEIDTSNATYQDKVLAYIVAGGNYGRGYNSPENGGNHDVTSRQGAIWNYINTWFGSETAKKYNLSNWDWSENDTASDDSWGSEVLTKAKEFASNKTENSTSASIESLKGLEIITSNTMAGPFKLKYTGKISKITVIDKDNNPITSGISFYSDAEENNKIENISDIKSERNFYIKNTSNKVLKKVAIDVDPIEKETLKVKIKFLAHKDDNSDPDVSGHQHLIKVEDEKVKNDKAFVEIKIKPYGSITINKQDAQTKEQINGAKFKIKTSSGWLVGKASDKKTYTSDVSKAEEYEVKNGTITIEKLQLGSYSIYETKAGDNYTLEKQPNYNKKNNWILIKRGLKINTETLNVPVPVTNERYGNLVIQKFDEDDKNIKLRAGFQIYSEDHKGWLKGEEGKYTYSNKKGDTYYTDETTGTKTLKNIDLGKYSVYETEAPKGYDLGIQVNKFGDGPESDRLLIDTQDLTAETPNKTITFQITNKLPKLISIEGYVWLEQSVNEKRPQYDDLYDANREKKLDNVTVRLIRKSDKAEIASTTTKDGGKYTFKEVVKKDEVSNYYVEFNYGNIENLKVEDKATKVKYTNYIPVSFNPVANGSKALVADIQDGKFDSEIPAIATTYAGTSQESKYGLSNAEIFKQYNETTRTLSNINLGLKPLPDVSYYAEEQLRTVRIEMNGYTFTYKYGTPGKIKGDNAPKVHFQSTTKPGIKGYTQPIYPSDIDYNYKDGKDSNALKVYVTYDINVENTMNWTSDSSNDYLYVEKALQISSLVNEFDTNRYVLNDSNWTLTGEGKAKLNNPATIKSSGAQNGAGIAGGKIGTTSIEFKVQNDEIAKELQDITEVVAKAEKTLPTKAIVNAYHEYTRNDYAWSNLEKHNSLVHNYTHKKNDEEKSPEAPYLIFVLGNERKITGKVFEDRVVTDDGQKLGNGRFDSGENVVRDVKVELLNSDGTTVKLYDIEYDLDRRQRPLGIKQSNVQDAITKTSETGEYSIKGIVPGEYFIRFTYGDGSYKVTDLNGNEVTTEFKSMINNTAVAIKDYKSTIVTSEKAKDAIENGSKVAKTEHLWYKSLERDDFSVAVDDLENRKEVTDGKASSIKANTPELSVTIENINTAEASVDSITGNAKTNVYGGLNFGIITQPVQDAKLGKSITQMSLVNAQNNKIFEGEPSAIKAQGVSDLSTNGNKGTYVRAELAEDTIYGSTLTLKYGITVTNTSDVNYDTEGYYKYGEDKTHELTLKIENVADYLDETLKYIPQGTDSKHQIQATTEIKQVEQSEDNETKKYILNITGWDTLYSQYSKTKPANSLSSDTATLTAQKILSTQDSDLTFTNEAEVTNLKSTAGELEISKIVKPVDGDKERKASAIITITPPTGADKQTQIWYIITAALALVVLSTGIIFIKKKVIK